MQDVRTKFLQSSARMILLSSPSTSRYLSSQSVELEHSRAILPSTGRENVCAACGNLLVPGWTSSMRTATEKEATKPRLVSEFKIRRRKLSQKCSSCHRISKQTTELKPNPRNLRRRPAVSTHATGKAAHEELPAEDAADKSTKVSSKKRAKARKDRQGLQALLDKSTQNKPRGGLNLMDFMKRP